MGRTNRSRKRTSEMNKVKKERNAAKDLLRLKRTLGLLDAEGNEIIKQVEEVVSVKTAKELKHEQYEKENEEVLKEILEKQDKGENVTVVNEKTGKEHTYNTKTLKDQHGSYPPWYKPRKTQRRINKLNHSRRTQFKQAWTTINVPL